MLRLKLTRGLPTLVVTLALGCGSDAEHGRPDGRVGWPPPPDALRVEDAHDDGDTVTPVGPDAASDDRDATADVRESAAPDPDGGERVDAGIAEAGDDGSHDPDGTPPSDGATQPDSPDDVAWADATEDTDVGHSDASGGPVDGAQPDAEPDVPNTDAGGGLVDSAQPDAEPDVSNTDASAASTDVHLEAVSVADGDSPEANASVDATSDPDVGAGLDATPQTDAGVDSLNSPDTGQDATVTPEGGPTPDGGGLFVESVAPTSGYLHDTVTLVGTGFSTNAIAGVRFGNQAAASFSVESGTRMSAVVPTTGLTAGPQTITLVLASGGQIMLPQTFTLLESFGVWRESISSSYSAAPTRNGPLVSGAPADRVLSAVSLDDPGYLEQPDDALFFNHLGSCASDGARLLVTDRNNNRVLLWNSIPTGNTKPDGVLGQTGFSTNQSGSGMASLNWPMQVSTAGNRVAVADTYNERVLLWDTFPTGNGQAASRSIRIAWPWGVWTNGTKLLATATQSGALYLWNTWPTTDDQAPDIIIEGVATSPQTLGTPRLITSDGNRIIVGDHNPRSGANPGAQHNWVWLTWPTANNQPPSYGSVPPQDDRYAWLAGDFASDGRLIMLGRNLYVYNTFPTTKDAFFAPSLAVTGNGSFQWEGGDGGGACAAGARVLVAMSNGNRVVGYHSTPTASTQNPDFAVGAPDIATNTLTGRYLLTNPTPATDGVALYASSDVGRSVSVWKQRPDTSGAFPDFVFHLPATPRSISLAADTLVVAGESRITLWTPAPKNGEFPTAAIQDSIGGVSLADMLAAAYGGTYFATTHRDAKKIAIWNGLPSSTTVPTAEISTAGDTPSAISIDGNLAAVVFQDQHRVRIYDLSQPTAAPSVIEGTPQTWRFNLPAGVHLRQGRLFVADTSFNRTLGWDSAAAAASGGSPTLLFGQPDLATTQAGLTASKQLMPGAIAFDGSYLWVGELKFSGRILRYSAQ